MSTGIHNLREAIRNRNLFPVVGAGFATATAGLPGWSGLLEIGRQFVESQLPNRPSENRLRTLEMFTQSGDLIEGLGYLQKLFANDNEPYYESLNYHGFLNEVFHNVNVESPNLGVAIRALRARILLTTNYDLLLEGLNVTDGRDSATWLNPSSIRQVLRSGSGVIHLHGRYDIPNSVVLSQSDYQRLVSDDDATAIAQAIFHSGVLLFIGSSVEGVEDPHMRRILSEFARMADKTRDEQSPHFALLKGRPTGMEIARLRSLGVEALSYGSSHDDLPKFLTKLCESDEVTIRSQAVRSLSQSTINERSKVTALQHVAEFIRREIFGDRQIRITFAEKEATGQSTILESRYVIPADSTHNVFNYPLSIAAWALIEGRIIAWPSDAGTLCDFDLIERLGKFDKVRQGILSPEAETSPEIVRYVDIASVRSSFDQQDLTLGDFFQDWSARQPRPRYTQFLCLPVPLVETFGNRGTVPEYGVFNIDTIGESPLLDRRSEELLKLAASFAAAICQRFSESE